jgi:hypothetical protein
MRYMMFIVHKELGVEAKPPQSLYDAMGEFVGAELASGRVVDTAGLRPSKEGKRIRSHNGKLTVTDGPFTEAKEIVGGYAVVIVATRNCSDCCRYQAGVRARARQLEAPRIGRRFAPFPH